MTDYSDLRRLAENAMKGPTTDPEWLRNVVVKAETVLQLLDENDAMRAVLAEIVGQFKRSSYGSSTWYGRARALLEGETPE